MASKAALEKNNRRKSLVTKYSAERTRLKQIIQDKNTPFEKSYAARQDLSLLPRNSNPNRVRNRCSATGRPRGYYRFFGLSRIALREMALKGELPGVRKGSL